MIIEFTGPTGAGKTTCAVDLVEALQTSGKSVVFIHGEVKTDIITEDSPFKIPGFILDTTRHNWKTDMYLLPWIVLFSLRFPRFSFFVFKKAINSPSHKVPVFRSVLRKMGVYLYFRRRKFRDSQIVIDEGIVHIAHNIFVSPDRLLYKADVDTFIKNVPLPDKVIVCQGGRKQLLQNLKKRGQWSTRVKNEQELERFVENAVQTFDFLVSSDRLQEKIMVCDSFDAKQEIEQSLI